MPREQADYTELKTTKIRMKKVLEEEVLKNTDFIYKISTKKSFYIYNITWYNITIKPIKKQAFFATNVV